MQTSSSTAPKRVRLPKKKHRLRRVVIFVLLVVPALIMVVQQAVFQAHSATATATVVGSVSFHETGKGSCSGGTGYYAEASFATADGDPVTDVIRNVQYCTSPPNGLTLQIRYNINDPSVAQTDDASNWGLPVLFLVAGAFVEVGALCNDKWGKPRRRAWRAKHDGPKQ